jgi:hypothetical protein
MPRKGKKSHNVYVVELSKSVWTADHKFRAANPHYMGAMECLYVGMTSLAPSERFKKHKTGAKSKKGYKISSKYVEKYGLYLRPSLFEQYNPLTLADAKVMEERLANSLRKEGYAVWWN